MKYDNVFAVTVTYGQRRGLLEKMLAATLAEGIVDVVIVDNGADWDVSQLLPLNHHANLHIVRMGCNRGSAAGFSAGIKAAINAGAEMMWLLDDDNRPVPGALNIMLTASSELLAGKNRARNALLAFRPEHQPEVARGTLQHRVNPRPSTFHCFHILDLPRKIWRRTPWASARNKAPKPLAARIDLVAAPYSGLLFHRSLINEIGFPRGDFVLYSDDTELTHRITKRGGRIILLTNAVLEDMESSWHIRRDGGTAIHSLLHGEGEFRIYYGLRNVIYFQTFCRSNNKIIFALNKHCYLGALKLFSAVSGRGERYKLIKRAVTDGLAGNLGLNDDFPL